MFDERLFTLIIMNIKSSVYNEYNIKKKKLKYVLWAMCNFQILHQTFLNQCLEKIGHLQKKLDHWCTQRCPENKDHPRPG